MLCEHCHCTQGMQCLHNGCSNEYKDHCAECIGQGLTSGWLVIDLRADLLTGER